MSFMKAFILPICLALLIISCNKEETLETVDCSKLNSSFSSNIKPIIIANCTATGCHNSNSSNGDLTTYAGIKKMSDNGTLTNRVLVQQNMPPTGPLPLNNLKLIKCWINSNAPDN
jgi:hypothetical protein